MCTYYCVYSSTCNHSKIQTLARRKFNKLIKVCQNTTEPKGICALLEGSVLTRGSCVRSTSTWSRIPYDPDKVLKTHLNRFLSHDRDAKSGNPSLGLIWNLLHSCSSRWAVCDKSSGRTKDALKDGSQKMQFFACEISKPVGYSYKTVKDRDFRKAAARPGPLSFPFKVFI